MIMMQTLTQLPIDLIIDILSRLPAKTLLCLKIVCKSLYNLISDDQFVNYHLERSLANKTNLHYAVTSPRVCMNLSKPDKRSCPVLYSADFDSLGNPIELNHPFKVCKTGVRVYGSCRGLLLLHIDDGQLLLYNPTTQTYNVPPLLPVFKPVRSSYAFYYFGFGYDIVLRDWKCVRILHILNTKPRKFSQCEVMVYSLNAKCWKSVLDVPMYFYNYNWGIGALVHEMLHWVGTNIDDIYEFIVAFSLRDETFSCLPLPSFQFVPYYNTYVGSFDGCLGLLANAHLRCNVWFMKEYGVAESWTRMFSIVEKCGWDSLQRPISFSMEEKYLFVKTSLLMLAYIDLQTMEITHKMFANCDRNTDLDAHVYVENLLMLDCAESADSIRIRKKRGKRKTKKRKRRSNN